MLKSLEKLKGTLWYDYLPMEDAYESVDTKRLAEEIQEEVEKYYIPRPRFEDGEPVQIGDFVDLQIKGKRNVRVIGINAWIVYGHSTAHHSTPYKRPPEPDSQEKLNDDVDTFAFTWTGYGEDDAAREQMKRGIELLLARQRKLDGVD